MPIFTGRSKRSLLTLTNAPRPLYNNETGAISRIELHRQAMTKRVTLLAGCGVEASDENLQ